MVPDWCSWVWTEAIDPQSSAPYAALLMALSPGTIIDRYILDGVFDEGGMAVVYRTRHRDLGSLHAIKQLGVSDPAISTRLH